MKDRGDTVLVCMDEVHARRTNCVVFIFQGPNVEMIKKKIHLHSVWAWPYFTYLFILLLLQTPKRC